MLKLVCQLLRKEDGPTAVEYAVLLALILVSVIVAVASVGAGTGGMWSNNASEIGNAMSGS